MLKISCTGGNGEADQIHRHRGKRHENLPNLHAMRGRYRRPQANLTITIQAVTSTMAKVTAKA
jgi:hypothetical protein